MRILLMALILIYCSACDCNQFVRGKVFDKESGLPIVNVSIQRDAPSTRNTISDANGYFELRAISGGLSGCPPMKVIIKKEGYDILKEKILAGGYKEFYLIKEKK